MLCREWNYAKLQVGSHVILETDVPRHQRIAVPNHKTLRVGTLNAILRTVATYKGVSREQVPKSPLDVDAVGWVSSNSLRFYAARCFRLRHGTQLRFFQPLGFLPGVNHAVNHRQI